MIEMIGILFRYRLRMLLSPFRESGKTGRTILTAIILLAIFSALYGFFIRIYSFAQTDPETGRFLIERLTAISFHGVFLFVSFYSLSYAVFALFFGRDLELLLSLPLKSSEVYLYKVTEATFLSLRLSFLLLIPSLAVLGIFNKASPFFYIAVALISILLASIPGSLGIIAASYISSRVKRGRLRNILAVTGALMGICLWVGINILMRIVPVSGPPADPSAFVRPNLLSSPIFSYLPSGWATKATISAAAGDWLISFIFFSMLGVCSVILIYLAYHATSKYYAGGVVEEAPELSASGELHPRVSGSPFFSHIKRDFLLIWRESNAFMQCTIMFVFLLLFPFVVAGADMSDSGQLSASPVGLIFAVVFGNLIGSRLIPLERLGFWWNLTTPSGRKLALASKAMVGLFFITGMIVFAGLIHITASVANGVGYILLLLGFSWAGFAAGLPLGLFFANFNWDNPNRMLKFGGRGLYLIAVSIVYTPLILIFYLADRFPLGTIDPSIPVLLTSIVLVILSMMITWTKLSNFEWLPGV